MPTATVAKTKKLTVTISYNGLPKPFDVEPHSTVQSLLQHAIQAFGITQQPHTFALYATTGELSDNVSVEEAGITKDEVLILRPSAVKGGS